MSFRLPTIPFPEIIRHGALERAPIEDIQLIKKLDELRLTVRARLIAMGLGKGAIRNLPGDLEAYVLNRFRMAYEVERAAAFLHVIGSTLENTRKDIKNCLHYPGRAELFTAIDAMVKRIQSGQNQQIATLLTEIDPWKDRGNPEQELARRAAMASEKYLQQGLATLSKDIE